MDTGATNEIQIFSIIDYSNYTIHIKFKKYVYDIAYEAILF
jgi:hypothetical protein